MSMFTATVPQLAKMLDNLDSWLVKAQVHAQSEDIDMQTLLTAQLAPDQFNLTKQIQTACDTAKFAATRLAGVASPIQSDTETTVKGLRERIAATRAIVDSVTAEQFAAAKDSPISPPFLKGRTVTPADYLNEFALPNFYFHATTTYAILRHNGVPLGKMDFIGSMRTNAAE